MQIWKQNQKNKNLDKVMFFLCDSTELKVLSITKNCSSLLGLKMKYLTGNEVVTKTNNFTITDICPLLDLRHIKEQEKNQFPETVMRCRIFEGIFDLKYTFFTNQAIKQNKINVKTKKPMQFKVFKESYFNQRVDFYIVALEFIEDGNTVDNMSPS